MLRLLFHAATITLYTVVLGTAATLGVLLLPGIASLQWFARPWARLIAMTCRTRIRAEGLERIPRERPCILMSNHASHFDLVALLMTLPGRYTILAKRELFYIPIFGWSLWASGMIPVDRAHRDRAIRSIQRGAERVRNGTTLLVFAEGTRSPDGSLQPFKKGGFHLAIQSGAPIVPISISGSRKILPRGSLRIRPGSIRVRIGEPIESGEPGPEGLRELIRRTREGIEAGLERESVS